MRSLSSIIRRARSSPRASRWRMPRAYHVRWLEVVCTVYTHLRLAPRGGIRRPHGAAHVVSIEWQTIGTDLVTLPSALRNRRAPSPVVSHRLCCIDTRSCVSRMNAFLRTLLVLAHLLHSLYAAIRYACDAVYRRCTDPWYASTTAELDVLVRTLTKANKIPRHLVIVLGLCDESVLDCVRIIGWCITLDIPYISFFDRNGKKTIWYWYIYMWRHREKSSKKKKNIVLCVYKYVYVYVYLCWRSSVICHANLIM